ncbi:hypothetical protein Pmar_PMAR009898 [Perkinsus marinus ATCC 50983]|uniref:Uncharacterized protein n=1 Tax=Perkinsus marinus (strain ATCC 50983 / TXsc) TaxID=423536 RepID=C5KIB8_PERM5|nr:hypothetical protein Pmar_PMAR009898 [Perkinsus marinus ATCC 50983]EER15781.1 hypothetical protein Pmar_PMAR009898 [Perkinsus marinus ATCC 50983]|eukprot:XP_002783985.1 hypothetical protein Pmar_PMAR009898 [Perkinsus marinus ATCC 50983]
MHFRRYHAGGLHVGPARTLLQIALKGIGVVEMNTALDYFTGLRENTAACTAAIYLCSKTDAKNGMLELLSSRSKGDPDSVGALHEAARRFCYRNVKSMLDYYGSGDSHKRASRIVNEEAVELTCKALAEVSDGDIVEELELAVRHRDELCARGILKAGNCPSWYHPLSNKDLQWFADLNAHLHRSVGAPEPLSY